MGHTYAKIRIYNLNDLSKTLDLNIIVDTGSTYTWIKRSKLNKIRIKPFSKRKFRIIKGEIIEREIGEAIIECMGEKATRIIVFAENGDMEVLGVDTLEGLGLEVDPITRQLRKVEMLIVY